MNCLSRAEIQEYIDGEIIPSATGEISKHLESCSDCLKLYNEALNDKDFINRVLGEADIDLPEISIPEFNRPRIKTIRKSYLGIIELFAAASIIGFIFLLQKANKSSFEKIPQAEILLYEFYDGQDLNKMWHEKSQIIIIQDAKGNVIQSILTN